jgi:hypothetical protein
VRYTVAFFRSGLCYGKGNAVPTRQARRAHNKAKHWIVKRWRVCRPLLLALWIKGIPMKFYVIAIFSIILIQLPAHAQPSSVQNTIKEWERQASQYPGDNPDLSMASKRAIVLGQPELAETPYLAMYKSDAGKKSGAIALYQIFLVYIDKYNSAKDVTKSKVYLDKLVAEWPESIEAKKAQEIYAAQNP